MNKVIHKLQETLGSSITNQRNPGYTNYKQEAPDIYVNTVEPVYSGRKPAVSWKKCLLLPGVRYIEVFNISRRKGKKGTLMYNNVLNK